MKGKPIKVYIRDDILKLMDEYGFDDLFLSNIVEQTLRQPFCDIMMISSEYNYDVILPTIVYVDSKYAVAWKNTPQQIKDRLTNAINIRLKEIIYSEVYIMQKSFCNNK